MAKHNIKVTNLDVSQISNLFGYDETEITETINQMVEKGLFKRVSKNTYDVSPFFEYLARIHEGIRTGKSKSNDIKRIYYEVTGKHVL